MGKSSGIVGIDNWRDDATSDTDFVKVIRASVGVVGNKGDFVLVVALCVLSAIGIAVAHCADVISHPREIAKMIGAWSTLSANMTVAILGFLIAGFSIFATMTRPSLFRFMARYKADGRSISDFKFVFYNFLYIFIHYLILLAVSVLTAIFFVPQSPIWFLAQIGYQRFPEFIQIASIAYGSFIVIYIVFALLLLKSFLWNLYQTLVFAIFVDPPITTQGQQDV